MTFRENDTVQITRACRYHKSRWQGEDAIGPDDVGLVVKQIGPAVIVTFGGRGYRINAKRLFHTRKAATP